jgi:transcription initiation factor IIE alpha subunit
MKTTNLPRSNCPKCKEPLDAATSNEDISPKPGDLTICINCGTMLKFNHNLSIEELTTDEFMDLHDDERIALKNMQTAIMAISNLLSHYNTTNQKQSIH